jgi:putative alpha-1,2-mannosidase
LTGGFTKFNPTVDYSRSDFAIARMAARMGKEEIAERYLRQANNFKSLADTERQRLFGKKPDDGSIKQQTYHGTNGEGWDFQYQFHPWHNLPFIWETLGGRDWAEKKLDAHVQKFLPAELFSYDPSAKHPKHFAEWACSEHEVIFHPWNEHGFHTPMLYNWLGKPWKTQALCRTLLVKGHVKPNEFKETTNRHYITFVVSLNSLEDIVSRTRKEKTCR